MKILGNTWNNAVISEDREIKPRDYVYASELGYPLVDRFLKMTAEPPTNPPNERSRRKFFAGDIWELIVKILYNVSGIMINDGRALRSDKYPLPISGKLDFTVGGKPNKAAALGFINNLHLSPKLEQFYKRVVEQMDETEIPICINEIKSVSEFVFERVLKTGSFPTHNGQAFFYAEAAGLPAVVSYVCRGDARLMEFDCRDVSTDIITELSLLKGYLDARERPPLEPLIKFEEKFNKNLSVEYSNYLTLLYGFKEPEDYRNEVAGKISRWNRVLARMKDIREGKRLKPTKKEPEGKLMELTPNNQAALTEMRLEGYEPEKLIETFDAKIEEDEIA